MMNGVVVLYPGCIYFEVAAAVSMLSDFLKFTFVSEARGLIADLHGLKIQAELAYGDVDLNTTACVIVTGGDIGSTLKSEELDHFLNRCGEVEHLTVAGICNSAFLLAKSGVLDGKRCTHMAIEKYSPQDRFGPLLDLAAPVNQKIRYVDEDVLAAAIFKRRTKHATQSHFP